MTLTSRLQWYYLGSLSLILMGFSSTLYFLARNHLHTQAIERLESSLNTLVAAVEIGEDGVEWEPSQRVLRTDHRTVDDQVIWLVTDDRGNIVEQSTRPETQAFFFDSSTPILTAKHNPTRLTWRESRWMVTQHTVAPPAIKNAPIDHATQHDPKIHSSLTITTAISLDSIRTNLRQLLMALVGVSLSVLCVATLLGRTVCRRAIRPVHNMATDLRGIDPEQREQRIDAPASRDELRDLALAFNNLLERLHESAERQKRFTGDASHQLRTPLTAILGQIEITLRRERSLEEHRQVLLTIQSQTTHLHRITESLLYLARADSDSQSPNTEVVNLGRWLCEYYQTLSTNQRFADIILLEIDNFTFVKTHSVLLGEILHILIDNACQYSPTGRPISLRLTRDQTTATIEVRDEGIGIAESDFPNLFTPFFRSAGALASNKTGIGLGLSIARRLANSLEIALGVSSVRNQGSRFTLTFSLEMQDNRLQ